MNIVMVTNTYTPLINGVVRSIMLLAEELRRRGHRVLVLAPQADASSEEETDVIRLPAIQSFNGSDLSVSLPVSSTLWERLDAFRPDVVHAHHPFLLGATAARIASHYQIPLIYTHHKMWEHYTHYVPGDFPALRHFVVELTVGYCNLANAVIAPSRSTAAILRSRGVESLVAVAPGGVDSESFRNGDRTAARRRWNISDQAFVVGSVGRMAPEKNVVFLVECLCEFLRRNPHAHLLLIGDGVERDELEERLDQRGLRGRAHFTGVLGDAELSDAYAAMDVLAFASHTNTQALAILEAMSAGVPVVAIDAPGIREVVSDGENGRLLRTESKPLFVNALEQLMSSSVRQDYAKAARATAETHSVAEWAELTLAVYRQAGDTRGQAKEVESSAWDKARERIELEMSLWKNRARAAGAVLTDGRHPSRVPGLKHVFKWWRRFRRWVSRREWTVRLLDLPVSQGTTDEPGLVILQIDGLARNQLEHAIQRGRMPFVRKLLQKESYRLETMYSGQPATTPAVLGELFYGVEQAVPAFGFRDHRSGAVVQMFMPSIAAQVQSELSQQGEGLLEEGCMYCDIYSGGAHDSSFCPATTGWRNFEEAGLWQWFALLLLNISSLFRIITLAIAEFFLACWDCVHGISRGFEVVHELLYIPRRMIVNIVMREMVSIGAEVDVTRGVRVLHANFLGYDENSHRRGPGSLFAHYTLRGIDRAIRRIWNAAHASHRRNYHIWIMADHGQEHVIPYLNEYGRNIDDAVKELYGKTPHPTPKRRNDPSNLGAQLERSRWIRRQKSFMDSLPLIGTSAEVDEPITVASGPLGYVYWPDPLDGNRTDEIARRLVAEAKVPLVLASIDSHVWAWTEQGRYSLPEQAAEFLAVNHPHLNDVARDLTKLCSHPDAGDFVIAGWRKQQQPLSFVSESGAHGGPGPCETSGFVLLPADAPFPDRRSGTFRPGTLRRMAMTVLRRGPLGIPERAEFNETPSLRVVTYNVHSCIGLDGRLSPSRIARVLASLAPDVIALQELDVLRHRSGFVDQAQQIAHALEMELHFHPSFQVEEGGYGNAILSRLPMKVINAGPLPQGPRKREPRGALWVEIDVGGTPLQFITTHLGTSPIERVVQVDHLLGPEWLDHPGCTGPLVLCGDFNAMPGSPSHRRMCAHLRDAQLLLKDHRPRRTWFGPLPLTRIDHVFVDDLVQVKAVDVPRSQLSKIASDHLPLVVELELTPVDVNDDQAVSSLTTASSDA